MANYTLPLGIRRPPSETGLTVLCTLSEDDGQTPLAGSKDIGSFVELPLYLSDGTTVWAIRYGRVDVPVPEGFVGAAVFHLGAVGVAVDFTGVDILQTIPLNPTEVEGVRPRKNRQFTLSFPMFSAIDGFALMTGLAVTAEISQDGAAFAAATNAVVEVGDGVYSLTLTAAEMDANSVAVKLTASGAAALPVILTPQP